MLGVVVVLLLLAAWHPPWMTGASFPLLLLFDSALVGIDLGWHCEMGC